MSLGVNVVEVVHVMMVAYVLQCYTTGFNVDSIIGSLPKGFQIKELYSRYYQRKSPRVDIRGLRYVSLT